MRGRCSWLALLLCALSAASQELSPKGPKQEISLTELAALLERRNLDLREASERLSQLQHEWRAAYDRLLPAVAVDLGWRRIEGRKQGSFGDFRSVEFSRTEGGLGLVLSLNPIAQWHAIEAAHYRYLGALEEREALRQQLLAQLATLYLDLALTRRRAELLRQRLANDQTIVELVQARLKAGRATADDLLRARAQQDLHRAELVAVERLWRELSLEVARLLRWPIPRLLYPKRLSPWKPPAVGSLDPRTHPQVRALKARVEATDRERSEKLWRLLAPQLELELHGLLLGHHPGDLHPGERYRVALSWRLSAAEWEEEQAAEAALRLTRDRLQRLLEAQEAELKKAEEALAAAHRRLREIEGAVSSLRAGIELAQRRYRLGRALLVELLDAENRLFEALLARAKAIYDLNLAQLRLLAASGRLTPEALRLLEEPASDPREGA